MKEGIAKWNRRLRYFGLKAKTLHLRHVFWICSSIFLERNTCIQTEQERNCFQISCSVLARAWEDNKLQLKHWQLIAQTVSPSDLFTVKVFSCFHSIHSLLFKEQNH